MVQGLTYTTVSNVIDSWEKLRQVKNFKEVAGVRLYKKLFSKCPKSKVLFGFPIDMDPYSLEAALSKRFAMHAAYLIDMLDTSLQLLGPDEELLTEILCEMGERHYRYGVTPEMFSIMGHCLMETLEESLPEKYFTESIRKCWIECFNAMTNDMIRSNVSTHMNKSRKSLTEKDDCSVTEACTEHESVEFYMY